MKDTFYIKLYGAPGAGKSTGASWIFANLKLLGLDSEYVQEVAKDMVWEANKFAFSDPDNQMFIFASQFYRLNRLNGKVDVVVTDSPLLLSELYIKDGSILNCDEYKSLVHKFNDKFNGVDILVKRAKKYNQNGRNQTEEESDKLACEIEALLQHNGKPFISIDGNEEGYKFACEKAIEKFEEFKNNNLKGI